MIPIFLFVFVIVSLAHDPLVSTSSCTDEICYNGWTVKDRSGPDGAGYTMISPDKQITCDGVVTQWRYQAKTSNSFRAVVWRPVPGSSTQFKIIGFTDIPAGPINQEVIFNVPEDQRFPVTVGDVIGWSFGDGVLAYNGGGGFSVRWLGGFLQSSLKVDQLHDFNGGNGDREYSILVGIDPVTGRNRLTGWPIRSRGGPDGAGYTMVSVETPFTCGGFVTEWHYQAKSNHPIRAIIFRQASPLQFSIVGINDIPAGPINRRVVYEVPLNDRVKVQRGDMIGWSCGPGVLDYKAEGNTNVRWVGGTLHASLGQGQLINIDGGSGNRRYSIAAMTKVYEDSGSECPGQMITTKDNKGQEIRQGKPQPIGSDAVNVIIQSPPGRDGRDGEAGPQGPQGSPGLPGTPAPDTGTGSTVYTRWGRTECPSSASLVYAGMAGGKWYDHTGSGSNYLCLPSDPEYDEYQAGTENWRGYVYSAEYEIVSFPPYAGKNNHEVPCAVCRTANRGSVVTIPAKMTCPSDWTREYHGYLMSDYHGRASSTEFVCVDRNPEDAAGSSAANENGAVFYLVESRCDAGKLPCTPYIDGAELTCVVCTK